MSGPAPFDQPPERLSDAWRERHLKAGDECLKLAHQYAVRNPEVPSLSDVARGQMFATMAAAHYQAADMYPYALDQDGRML